MKRIAVVMPFRRNPNRGDRVAQLCVASWLNDPLVDALILVDGSAEPLETSASEKMIHIHCPYDGDFNLSFMRNVGVRRACDDGFFFVQIMDTDIFPQSSKYLQNCIKKISSVDMIRPYVVNSDQSAEDFEEDSFAEFLNPNLETLKIKRHSYSTMFMRVKVPLRINGWDQEYKIWGAEDDDFLARATKSGFKAGTLTDPCLIHSHHNKDTADLAKNKTDQYNKNLKRFQKTMRGELPIKRGSDNWGLELHP